MELYTSFIIDLYIPRFFIRCSCACLYCKWESEFGSSSP